MSKLNFSIISILIFVSVLLVNIDMIYKNSLPLISLPKYFQNTISEIPMVKEIDDISMEIQKNSDKSGRMFYGAITGCVISYSDY